MTCLKLGQRNGFEMEEFEGDRRTHRGYPEAALWSQGYQTFIGGKGYLGESFVASEDVAD